MAIGTFGVEKMRSDYVCIFPRADLELHEFSFKF